MTGGLTVGVLVAALALAHVPLGGYLARVFQDRRHLAVERALYRVARVDPEADQRWTAYGRALLGFSLVSVLLLYGLLRLQGVLPLSQGQDGVPPAGALNTAVSFVSNTNWQWYAGESTLGYLVPALGLTVQNFLSAAVGLAVAVALVRSFTRSGTDRLGSFWVDLVRGTVRVLLPLAVLAALALLACGVVQSLGAPQEVRTVDGGEQWLPGGPVASQVAIRSLGTNGGGFFQANAAHPFENPTPLSNLLQAFLVLLIPSALPRMFGRMTGRPRQGWALLAAMAVLWGGGLAAVTAFETAHRGSVPEAAGAALEGKEQRFGVVDSAVFAGTSAASAGGQVDASLDSFTALGGGTVLAPLLAGEVAPGGVGAGLYGMLVLALVAVFLAGLMVGRTPEFLGRKIRQREVTHVALYTLTLPVTVLLGTAVAVSFAQPRDAPLNEPPHGLTETLYAFASATANNGSALAGLAADGTFYQVALALAMLVGRYLPMLLVLALAGSLAAQHPVPENRGTLPTHGPLFVGLLLAVGVLVVGLAFFPALALGPVAEGLT